MDYEGSRIYDEYPDKYMFYHLCSKIKESMKPEIKAQAEQSCFLDELYMCFGHGNLQETLQEKTLQRNLLSLVRTLHCLHVLSDSNLKIY